jgi:hypothetical protein
LTTGSAVGTMTVFGLLLAALTGLPLGIMGAGARS